MISSTLLCDSTNEQNIKHTLNKESVSSFIRDLWSEKHPKSVFGMYM